MTKFSKIRTRRFPQPFALIFSKLKAPGDSKSKISFVGDPRENDEGNKTVFPIKSESGAEQRKDISETSERGPIFTNR